MRLQASEGQKHTELKAKAPEPLHTSRQKGKPYSTNWVITMNKHSLFLKKGFPNERILRAVLQGAPQKTNLHPAARMFQSTKA